MLVLQKRETNYCSLLIVIKGASLCAGLQYEPFEALVKVTWTTPSVTFDRGHLVSINNTTSPIDGFFNGCCHLCTLCKVDKIFHGPTLQIWHIKKQECQNLILIRNCRVFSPVLAPQYTGVNNLNKWVTV